MPIMYRAICSALLFTAHILFSGAKGQDLTSPSQFNCQPQDPCWPRDAEWEAFNQTVSGRLQATVMFSSPCFPSSPNFDNATCAIIHQNYFNGTFRPEVYGSLETTQWESCGAANCYPGIVPPQGATCSLGRLSALYVDAVTTSDIVATLNFVKMHGIRLVIKNTGHDYLGRSAAANTLALRTYNLKKMEFHQSFTGYNCPASNKQNIGLIGAGVTAEELLAFFATYGMMATVSGCPTVGIAGGFGQGGGHGPLAPTYGLMVDQAIEFDVITTDGVLRTINQCNDPDLFWALRGGGGQSYAILVNYKFQLYPSTQFATHTVVATIASNSSNITQSTVLRNILTALANNQTTWSKNRIAGYNFFTPTTVAFLDILPGAGDPLGTLKELTADFNAFLTNLPDVNITLNTYSVSPNAEVFFAGLAAFLSQGGGPGFATLAPSRLITSDNFATPSTVDSLVTSILEGMQAVMNLAGPKLAAQVGFLLSKTTPFNSPDSAQATSANPAWRDALWHLIIEGIWLPGTPDSESEQISTAARAALDQIKQNLTVQASYLNEADPDEPNWEEVFYGAENYNRLVQIKHRWDPDGVLNCWKCIGWLGPQDPMYSCYGNNPVPSSPFQFSA
jgi:hypothetical protein